MNLQNKVSNLVRYCGQYQSHGFMIDERNMDESFNVILPEEEIIRENINNLKLILLTGEAGDGKSRILRNIRPLLSSHGFNNPCQDFSALSESEKKKMVERIQKVLDGSSTERLFILANVGVFTQSVIKYDMNLMQELTRGREDIFICNFENRNLAQNEETFQKIVKTFYMCDLNCPKTECICHETCAYKINIQKLTSESGLKALRTICNTIYLIGGHLTFRELLSLLAYAVTFGQNCKERQQYLSSDGDKEKIVYYNIFEKNDDLLLKKVSSMDPALKRGEAIPDSVTTKAEYLRYRRRKFFEANEESYEMLNVDYLVEFYQVLQYMNQWPYHYDTVHDKNVILHKLKRGINKMSNQGKSDAGLVITDTPLILGNNIRTEFLISQDMSMIWHRYDLQITEQNNAGDKLWNCFCLSYMSEEKDKKLISLLINYRQFCYLMMSDEDYFLNKNELTMEEYAVNTFYRKIMQEKEKAYNSFIIRFDKKTECMCDFSLSVHTLTDWFTGEKKQTIRIRKEE